MKLPFTIRSWKFAVAVLLGLVLVAAILYGLGRPKKDIRWGITFSTVRARDLGFEPTALFPAIMNDLQPPLVRLPVYWSEIETNRGQYNFAEFDQLIAEANRHNAKILLVLGYKQPRWPECHAPQWWSSLSVNEQNQSVLNMITASVNHFKNNPAITEWQIENEPYFPYGPDCPTVSSALYKQELAAVKALDNRPIVGTDSGEKGAWLPTAWSGVDILGSTMYREVYYDKQARYITYPLPAATYNIKAGLVRLLSGTNQTIGVELQAEPWFAGKGAQQTPLDEQLKHMNPTILEQNISYATKVGFSENYLWGVEWWYWLKQTQKDDSMVLSAKKLFNQ